MKNHADDIVRQATRPLERRWPLWSISWKVNLLGLAAVTLTIILGAAVFDRVGVFEKDAAVVNMAGRQRMLIQRQVKDALLAVQGDEQARSHLPLWREEFSNSLDSLWNGDPDRGIPPAPPEVAPTFSHVVKDWESFAVAVIQVETAPTGSPQQQESLGFLVAHEANLLNQLEEVVARYETYYGGKQTNLRWFVVVYAVLAIALTIVGVLFARKGVSQPLVRLAQSVEQVGRGDPLKLEPRDLRRGDEIGSLSRRFLDVMTALAENERELESAGARESELRQRAEVEQARLQAIIDSSAAGIVVIEAPDGKVVLANQETARILGFVLSPGDRRELYEHAAVYRKPDGSLFELETQPLRRALAEGIMSQGVDVVFDLPDGRRIPTLVSAAPVYDPGGKITAAIAIIDDITARQEVEQLKADFLSMVSHDLRGPLATIKGHSSGLLMAQGPRDMATVLQYARSIDEEADRMTELVGNLLDMSRIEANSMPLDPELCHLADIVSECVRRVERSRLGGEHDIGVDVPLELPEIYADYDQISRVLSNLLSNAIKYSPPGSEIRVRSYLGTDDSGVIVSEVRDQGAGISKSEMEQIFDKFYRVTSPTGRGRPGSGLGLAICKAIVEAHEGKIWVESKPGKGSTFYFSLPQSWE